MYSTPRTHLGPFQAYRWGTISRSGEPCSAVSSLPSLLVAKRGRPQVTSASRRLDLTPYSAPTTTSVTSGAGGALSTPVPAGIPPHPAPTMLNLVTQCRSASTVVYGRA